MKPALIPVLNTNFREDQPYDDLSYGRICRLLSTGKERADIYRVPGPTRRDYPTPQNMQWLDGLVLDADLLTMPRKRTFAVEELSGGRRQAALAL